MNAMRTLLAALLLLAVALGGFGCKPKGSDSPGAAATGNPKVPAGAKRPPMWAARVSVACPSASRT